MVLKRTKDAFGNTYYAEKKSGLAFQTRGEYKEYLKQGRPRNILAFRNWYRNGKDKYNLFS